MKRALPFAAALLTALTLHSQAPINDAFNCATMVDLGIAPACLGDIFTNVNATPSVIATIDTVSCFNSATAQRDVWFKFVCSDTIYDYRIALHAAGGDPIENPEFAIYRGDCMFNGLSEIACARAGVGEDSISVDLFGLLPQETYYIRVSDWSATAAPNSGQFTLCVDKIPEVLTINQGGSPLCQGTLYDSGGPNADYSANENYTFVICPDQPSECIAFTLEYYHLEPSAPPATGLGDQLFFYDGPTVTSPLLAALDGAGAAVQNVAGGGGIGFQVQATSGCLTIRFKSDGSVQEEGWKGSWICSSDPCLPQTTIQVDTTVTDADITGAVSTGGAMVTVTSVNCPQGGMGTFVYPSANNTLNMEKGLLLTSGQALNALGPNNADNTGSQNEPYGIDDVGDPDLQYLSEVFGSGSVSYDVCIVELDVFAATNEVVFEYVLGSEEYPEYVFDPEGYNDIFAFLVSGPGIVGDPNLTNNALNIALLPNTSTPVQIDSVNNLVHWQNYRNNELGQTLEYDGLTTDFLGVKKSLTARVPVIPCNTYHLKLAIADRGDELFDSGVFISEIKAGSPKLEIAFNSGVDYFVENCTGSNDTLFFTLDKAPAVATEFTVSVGGTATIIDDYLLDIPDTIVFQPGQQTLAFPIIPVSDNITENPESITIIISHDYGCNSVDLDTLTVNIFDNVVVDIGGNDTLTMCKGDFLQLNATGASHYVWEPPTAVSNPYIPNPYTSPAQSVLLVVHGAVGSCPASDSVYIRVISPTIDVTNLTPNIICLGGTVQLQAVSSEPAITWTPATGLDDPNSFTPIATPPNSITYTASATLDECTVKDSVTITVDMLVLPTVIDSLIQCQNVPVQLANNVSSTNTYSWEPTAGLSDPHVSGPVALPDTTTLYILTVTSINHVCTWKDSVLLTITPSDIEILGKDTIKICLGDDPVELVASTTPGGSEVHWSPADFLSSSTGNSVTADPAESVTITATFSVNGCPPVSDKVYIRLDSLPFLGINAILPKQYYCPGDTIYLNTDPLFAPGNTEEGYGNIHHEWEPFGTQLTSLYLLNLYVIASDSNVYRRHTWNGACEHTDTILIPVPRLELDYSVDKDTLCPGEMAEIMVTTDPAGAALEWDPMTAGTLDCDKCALVHATPLVSTTYHVTTPDAPCPTGADVHIEVIPFPELNLTDKISCELVPVTLNDSHETGVTYNWIPSLFLDDAHTWNPVATPTQPGDYTYFVEAKRHHCSTPGTVTLHAYKATIDVNTPPQKLCEGSSLTLDATGSPGNITWSPAGPNVVVTTDTTYVATLAYGMGCIAKDSVAIEVIALPELSLANNPTVCAGIPAQLNSTNEPGIVTYHWTPSNGLNNVNIGNPTATPLDTITYHVDALTIETNSLGQRCKAEGDVTVNVAMATVKAGDDQTVCFGSPATLTATVTGATGGFFEWSNNQTGNPITVSPIFDQTYTVHYYYADTMCVATDVVTVKVGDALGLSAIAGPADSVCAGAPVVLKVKIDFGDGDLAWFADGVEIPGQTLDTILVTPQGGSVKYTVMLTDAHECTTVSEPFTVNTKKCFEVPNAFTPNGDAANDTFGPVLFGGSAEVISFAIYNRWGQKVFEATPEQKEWDGKQDGKDASSDVYVYTLRVRFGNGEEKEEHGEVTLIR